MMLPFKRILCPTDFSDPSYEALKAGKELAAHFGAELLLLNVVTPVPVVPLTPAPMAPDLLVNEQGLIYSATKTLEEVVSQIESKDLKVRFFVLQGNPADEIVRLAADKEADVIVIATRGRTGLDRFFFGSVAEKVVRLAQCPVFTIAGGERPSTAAAETGPDTGNGEKKAG